ncbi:MAG: EF-hand domain-containing protein [Alphaproteobacteria bacterium]
MRRKILILLTAAMVIIGVGAAALAQIGGKAMDRGGHGGPGAFGASQGATRMFERLDANSDGVVTLDEVGAMRGGRFDRPDRFDRFDRNGDGTVTKAELEQVLEARLATMRDRILQRFDGNNDGQVTRQEFDARATNRFSRFDQNGDGQVTRQEFDMVRADWRAMRGRMHKMGMHFWGAHDPGKQ